MTLEGTATLADMTEIAASDFRPSQRHIRLDTILRLRWLAVLGQLAAIFIVAWDILAQARDAAETLLSNPVIEDVVNVEVVEA